MRSGSRSSWLEGGSAWQLSQDSSEGVALPSTSRAPLSRARSRATSRAW